MTTNKILDGAREAAELAKHADLIEFLAESNRIEGILSVRSEEVYARSSFSGRRSSRSRTCRPMCR